VSRSVHSDPPRSAPVVTQLVTHLCTAARTSDVAGDLDEKAEMMPEVCRVGTYNRDLGGSRTMTYSSRRDAKSSVDELLPGRAFPGSPPSAG
jgi:hypothetical protein